mgnify:CR=1 FL=1
MNAAREIIESRLSRLEFTVLMSTIMAVGALAIDMMLPAFGEMREHFGLAADSNALAAVVTLFLVGLGVGQPLWGPLSDSLGRKRVLWAGLSIYIVAAVIAAFSPSLPVLLAFRFLGGFGAGAARVVSQGVIRDAYAGEQMAKILSYIMAVFILVPIIAPSVGSAVLAVSGWQTIFFVIAGFGVFGILWSSRLPETLPPERRIPLSFTKLARGAKAVMTSRFAMGFTLAQTLVFGFFASYLASSQLIIDDVFNLGVWFPIIFGAQAALLGTGMLFNPRLIDRFGLRRLLQLVLAGYVVSSLWFLAIGLATGGTPPFWLFLAGLAPILICHAFVIPNLNSAAMIPMGNVAGTAAAVIGSIATLGGALIGAVIDSTYDGTTLPLMIGSAVVCSVGYAFYRWSDAVWDEATAEQLTPTS